MSAMTTFVPTLTRCRCGCGRPVKCMNLAASCHVWWLGNGRPASVPPPEARKGGRPSDVPLRDALKVYLWQHMSAYRQSWFTAAELCRVIAEQYTLEQSAHRTGYAGRTGTVKSCLAELMEAGEVEYREIPRDGRVGAGPGRSTAVRKQYRWCG